MDGWWETPKTLTTHYMWTNVPTSNIRMTVIWTVLVLHYKLKALLLVAQWLERWCTSPVAQVRILAVLFNVQSQLVQATAELLGNLKVLSQNSSTKKSVDA